MKKTLALAALLAATAFTPALAQEEPRQGRRMPTAEEPTPVSMQAEVQVAQRERGERGPRGDNGGGDRAQGNAGQGRAEGGWQRQQQAAPVAQAPAAPAQVQVQVQQAPPAQRQWNGGNNGGARNWQGQQRPDWSARTQNGQVNQGGQQGWSRPTPPVATAPVPAQPQGNWQNREARRDTWRNDNRDNGGVSGGGNGGVVVQRQDNRGWNGNNGWSGQNRGVQQRNDTWRNDGRTNNRSYDQRSQYQNQYRDWNRNWSRDWRRDQRYDWQRYRYSNRSLFSSQRYYAPYGWDYGYRRFSIGFGLSSLLYDRQYWIDDPYSYRLPPAYGPYRWVRYYDDVLLVDLRSGQVIDAIYDFFD